MSSPWAAWGPPPPPPAARAPPRAPPVAPPPLLPLFEGQEDAGGVHGRGSPEGPDYLTVVPEDGSFLTDGEPGDQEPEEVREAHRLAQEVPGDPLCRVDPEHELEVVDLRRAHDPGDGLVRLRVGDLDPADRRVPFPGRRQAHDVPPAP